MIPLFSVIKTFNLCDECFTVNEAVKEIYAKLGVSNTISIVPNASDMVTSETIDEDKAYINKKYADKKYYFIKYLHYFFIR